MSTLSELLPSGGGGSTVDFVASGTLPNGKPVILKANGTVEVVGESTISQSIPLHTKTVIESGYHHVTVCAFDPINSNKIVVAYYHGANTGAGTAVAGTISGNSISFGTPVVFHSEYAYDIVIAFDRKTSGSFLVAFMANATQSHGKAYAGNLSGTTITFGSVSTFYSSATSIKSIDFDPFLAGRFIIGFMNGTNGYPITVLGDLSGTSITIRSTVTVQSVNCSGFINVKFDPFVQNSFIVAYRGSSNYIRCIIGTVSGTNHSYGSSTTVTSANTSYPKVAFDPNTSGKFIYTYQNSGNGRGEARVGTKSGSSLSFGTTASFNSVNSNFHTMDFDPNQAGKFAIGYQDVPNGNSRAVVGTISGTSVSFSSQYTFNTAALYSSALRFDPFNFGKFIVSFSDADNGYASTYVFGQVEATVTNLTSTNFVGTSTKAYTNAQTATIAVQGGLSTNQTGLTIGSTYFVQPAGTLATTAGTPSVNAGKALSATTLLLKDL